MKKTLLWAVLLCMASVLPMSAQSTCNHQYDSDDQTHCTLCNHYFVHYTSTDGNIVKPLGAKPFGEAAIVSNTYENGRGIIELDNVPTAIGAGAYNEVETLKTFEFPKTIESIGNLAFMCCTGLTTISEFPSTLKSIGRYGFYACLNLGGELVLPNSVTFLDSFVFGGCHYVTKITIPESITEIPNHAFEYCKRLKTVVLPESLITIGVDAFRNCYVLEEQVIPNSVQTIKDGAFSDCPLLASVNIPKSLVTIERNAFKGSPKLNIKMDMPNTLVSIGDYAFYNCTSINSELVLGNSLTTIGRYAFYNCTGLHGALTIPNSVTEIDSRAFKNCTGFTGTLSIGDKLTELRDSVFANCSGFENVIVGKSVNDIAKSFIGCTGVKTVHFKNTTPATFYNIGFNDQYVCFYVPESALSTYRADKNWKYAFYDRLFIEPCKHEYTQENPYYCTKCKHYLVHYTTDNGTFLHTPWRDDVTKYFNDCDIIGNQYEDGKGYLVLSKAPTILYSGLYPQLETISFPNSMKKLFQRALDGSHIKGHMRLPSALEYIGYECFLGCEKMTSVTIPATMNTISYWAFKNCNSMHKVYCHATTPPACDLYSRDNTWGSFDGLPEDFVIYVPDASVAAYKAALGWKEYASHIKGLSEEPKVLAGDLDGNGKLDVSDVTALLNHILGTASYEDALCDVDGNGRIDVSDVTALINKVLAI